MKSFCFSLLLLFIFSCGSNQSLLNNKQSNTFNANRNIDCSEEIKEYIINSEGTNTSTQRISVNSISKQNDGSYFVSLISASATQLGGFYGDSKGSSYRRQVWVNDNCKVIKVK
ncbi:hypothetical protein JYU05_00700 [bacterium AH-315-P13]|nr:hypothetical protein [bacterium AH-315-P13]